MEEETLPPPPYTKSGQVGSKGALVVIGIHGTTAHKRADFFVAKTETGLNLGDYDWATNPSLLGSVMSSESGSRMLTTIPVPNDYWWGVAITNVPDLDTRITVFPANGISPPA